jgi:hypothetical protein
MFHVTNPGPQGSVEVSFEIMTADEARKFPGKFQIPKKKKKNFTKKKN